MKKLLVTLIVLLIANTDSFSQTESKASILFDGLYIAKTGSVPAANLEIFTYLRFYEDGTVYLQAVSSNDTEAVSKWFGRDKKFSQKGTYKIEGATIRIFLDNKNTADAKLEGDVETNYQGFIKQKSELCMIRNKEKEEHCFVFTKTN